MKFLVAFIFLTCTAWAQTQQEGAPLTDDEWLETIQRLDELKVARDRIAFDEAARIRDAAQDLREQQSCEKMIAAEQKGREVAEKETQIWRERSDEYKASYEALLAKPGWGCVVKRILSLGIARCH